MKKLILRAFALALAVMMLMMSSGLAATIKLYDKGENVKTLQAALSDQKLYTGSIDGKFGPATLKAVKAFQKANGLKVDGLVGKATQAKLTELTGAIFEDEEVDVPDKPTAPKTLFAGNYHTMQFGNGGARVRVLQRCLLALGFDVKVDGAYGSSTYRAVKAFQAIVGLTQDGKAGERTLKKLEAYFDADGNCLSGPIAGNKPATPEPDPDAPAYGIPTRTLRYGATGLDVKYTMKRLYDLKYYNKAADEKFGSGMLSAVKAFQKKNGLTVDGVVGPKTIEVLFSADAIKADALTPPAAPKPLQLPLKRGDKGTEVTEVQNALKNLGYAVGKVDGSYGEKTQAAVKLFQARNGLTVDGKVDQRTLDRLFSADAVPATGKAPDTTTPGTDAPEVIIPGDG